jgi:RNA polymerase sigma-70 factor (ECF subfamily)
MREAVPSPDLFLARRAAAGHEEAWAELVDRYGARIFNLALHFAGSREDAEDLTQEVFVRFHRGLRTYRGEVPLIAWALRLSRNLCIDHYRKARLERSWRTASCEALEELPAKGDLEVELQRRQRLEAVYASLADLPEEYAEAVLFCDLQGWSLEEAAAAFEIPLGTLKSRLHRGRLRLGEEVRTRLAPRETDVETQLREVAP